MLRVYQAMDAPTTHTIPENRLGQLRAGVAKLNKRAVKLGLEPVVLVVSEPRSQLITELLPAEYQEAGRIPSTTQRHVYVVDVSFTGTAPRVGGFSFVARLDHQEGGNLVLRAPGVETDLDGWRLTGSRCQHCGLDRRRSATFLLQNEQGALVQVGKSCLEDYTGTTNIASAVELFKCWQEILVGLGGDGEYGFGFGGGWQPDVTPVEYLGCAVASIRHRGFHKSGSERSTRNDCDFLSAPCPLDKGRKGEKEMVEAWKKGQPTDAQREEAAAILAWAVASKDSGDYMHNARIACAGRVLIARTEGLLASLPVSYDKAMGIERERKVRPAAGPHVGTIGERITTKVTVKLVRGYESDFGTGVMILMLDENNSTLKTFSSGRALQDQENFDGEWYLRGTVKKHETDDKYGEPVTLLKRCELQREVFPALKPAKPKPASKGKPFYGYLPNGTVGVTAYQWKAPAGVRVEWFADSYTNAWSERGLVPAQRVEQERDAVAS